ncbi:V-type proton ATPase subunit C-like isoform X2 [Camellia sinensis]|uniref:V-type proton ATPase subunit C-like isoform X2 n=1 Tax=Camellia sinensis TaxID=4442 RepID=UPI0010361281|nr:V-type proton ATPase subunit C-like isoform X2 [Camellia sinensis]
MISQYVVNMIKFLVDSYNNPIPAILKIPSKDHPYDPTHDSVLSNLAVCDLSNLVKPQDIIITEHLTTLLAIVPKYSQKDWLSSYKTLTAYVVPRSSTKLHEDNEYALYTVTLFSRDADNFRTKARDRGFQIRDFEYNPETQESRKQELEKLMQDQETLRNSLCNGAMQLWGGSSLAFRLIT